MQTPVIKVKHVLIISQEAVDALFKIVQDAVSATYLTKEEETVAVAKAKADFESMLNLIVHKSFKAGRKIGKKLGTSTSKDVAIL
ncbi:MAG: hypothetical protein NTV98_06075 [Candidatus Roizmanbacteria bacterium]|nr:hypothetical protein [Candidatus Roizmanbacteria bacterium]